MPVENIGRAMKDVTTSVTIQQEQMDTPSRRSKETGATRGIQARRRMLQTREINLTEGKRVLKSAKEPHGREDAEMARSEQRPSEY